MALVDIRRHLSCRETKRQQVADFRPTSRTVSRPGFCGRQQRALYHDRRVELAGGQWGSH